MELLWTVLVCIEAIFCEISFDFGFVLFYFFSSVQSHLFPVNSTSLCILSIVNVWMRFCRYVKKSADSAVAFHESNCVLFMFTKRQRTQQKRKIILFFNPSIKFIVYFYRLHGFVLTLKPYWLFKTIRSQKTTAFRLLMITRNHHRIKIEFGNCEYVMLKNRIRAGTW